jgi:hypothetical protein
VKVYSFIFEHVARSLRERSRPENVPWFQITARWSDTRCRMDALLIIRMWEMWELSTVMEENAGLKLPSQLWRLHNITASPTSSVTNSDWQQPGGWWWRASSQLLPGVTLSSGNATPPLPVIPPYVLFLLPLIHGAWILLWSACWLNPLINLSPWGLSNNHCATLSNPMHGGRSLRM